MARILKKRTYVKKWMYPALLVAVGIGMGIGAFWGRINTINCNRTKNLCEVKSRGFLYQVEDYQIPIDRIRNLELYSTDTSMKTQGSGSRMSWAYTEYDIHIDWEPVSPQAPKDSVDIKVYDVFTYKDPVLKAIDDLAGFLNDPGQNEINIVYGTHATGYVFSAIFALMLSYFVLSNGIWRIRLRASEKQIWKGLADGTDDKTQIKRVTIDIGIFKGIWKGPHSTPNISILRLLYEGTTYQITDSIRLIHPWGAEEVKDTATDKFPRGMPKVFRNEIESIFAEATQTFFPAS